MDRLLGGGGVGGGGGGGGGKGYVGPYKIIGGAGTLPKLFIRLCFII